MGRDDNPFARRALLASRALRRLVGGESLAEALSTRLRELDEKGRARRAAGDKGGALQVYREAIGLLHHLRRTFGDDERLLEWFSWHFNTVGELEEELGDRVAARASYAQGNDFGRTALAAGDTNAWMYRDLSHGLYSVGHMDWWLGAMDSAISAYSEAVEVSRRLVDLDGTNADDAYRLAYCLHCLGEALSRQADFVRAAKVLGEAVSAARRSADLSGERPRELHQLSTSLCALAGVQMERCEPAYARLSVSEAVEIGRRLERLDATDATFLGCLYDALDRAGDVAFHEGRYEEASPLFQEAAEIARRLVQVQGESVETLLNVGTALFGVGNAASSRNASKEAATAYRAAVGVQRSVVEHEKSRADRRRHLTPLLRYLGLAELETGDVVAARASIEEAVSICRELACAESEGETASDLMHALLALARLERTAGNVEAARAAYDEALAVSESALRSRPDDPETIRDAAEALYKTAEFEVSVGYHEGATANSRHCVDAVKRYAAVVGEDWNRLDYPVDTLEWLGDAFLRSGHANEALVLRDEWLAVQRNLARPVEASEETLQIFASALRQVILESEAAGRLSKSAPCREELAVVEERLRQLEGSAAQPASLPT